MSKRLSLILALGSAIGLLSIYFWNAYQFLSKSYYIDENNLYQVDTFYLYTRAFESSYGGGGKLSSAKSKLTFEDFNRNSFTIAGNIFEAITDKQKLEDTLMYHDLKFTVFTDKENYDEYKRGKKPDFIKVYQIQIGDTKYIDIAKMNKISKGELMRGIILPPAFIFFMVILPFKEDNDWPKWKIVVWCIAFFLTTILLLMLT